MDELIINYKRLAADEAVKALDEDLSEEERKEHYLMMQKFNQTYCEMIQAEHDFNDPVRERKERNAELWRTAVNSGLTFFGNLSIAALFAYVDTRPDSIPGFGSKEWFKHIRFK